MKKDSGDNVWLVVGRYLALMSTVPAAIFAGYAIGAGLDRLFSTRFLKIVFVVLGTAAGFVPIVRDLGRDERSGD